MIQVNLINARSDLFHVSNVTGGAVNSTPLAAALRQCGSLRHRDSATDGENSRNNKVRCVLWQCRRHNCHLKTISSSYLVTCIFYFHRSKNGKFWTAKSIESHLLTRFCQFKTTLHRYTNSFACVNPDILIRNAKLVLSYYEHPLTLFWVGVNCLSDTGKFSLRGGDEVFAKIRRRFGA